MTSLVGFLRARYAERREQIQGHDGSHNDADGCWGLHEDPAAALADLDAKAALLDLYETVADMDTEDAEPEFAYGRAAGLGEAVRRLATPFAAHPDYKEKWACWR